MSKLIHNIFKKYTTTPIVTIAHNQLLPIIGQVNRASATETVDTDRFLVGSNQRLQKLAFTTFLLDIQP